MAKPQLVKVEALFYVLQQVIKWGCAYFDTAPCYVRPGGLEPPRPKTLDPKSNAATNYATGANVPQRYDFFLNCRPLCGGV